MNNSNGHVQRLTEPSHKIVGVLSQYEETIRIIPPTKNVNSIPNELLGVVPKIEEVDPLQPNVVHETAGETLAEDDNFDEEK